MLFHVSEEPGIVEFSPRPSKYTQDPVVWAVNEEEIRNYLLPRDCPRVTYYADANTAPEDSARFLGTSAAVVAIEAALVESDSRLHAVQLSHAGGVVYLHRRVRRILRQP